MTEFVRLFQYTQPSHSFNQLMYLPLHHPSVRKAVYIEVVQDSKAIKLTSLKIANNNRTLKRVPIVRSPQLTPVVKLSQDQPVSGTFVQI